jgi:hypothetical protein
MRRKNIIISFALMVSASLCLAIEEPIVTDTAHPRATLAPLSGLQGFSKDLRVYVRNDGHQYGIATGSAVVLFYGTNLNSMYVGTATSSSVRTNDGSALVRTVALPPGNFRYALGIVEGGRTNDLGTGLLTVSASSFGGGFSPIPGQTIDWSALQWAGSNQPMRASAPDGVTVVLSNGVLSAIAAAAPDLTARAAIVEETNRAQQAEAQIVESLTGISNALAPGASAGLTAVQPATLAGYVATDDAAYLAAITGAVYGAQDGPSVSGRLLTVGTNLFGGGTGGGSSTDTLQDVANRGRWATNQIWIGPMPDGLTNVPGLRFGVFGKNGETNWLGIAGDPLKPSGINFYESGWGIYSMGDPYYDRLIIGSRDPLQSDEMVFIRGYLPQWNSGYGMSNGSFIVENYPGNGGSLSNLNGSAIQSGTTPTNVMDATADLAYRNLATNSIGASGSGYYALTNSGGTIQWTAFTPGTGGGTSTGGVTSAQVSNIVNGAVSNWATNPATATINAGTNAIVTSDGIYGSRYWFGTNAYEYYNGTGIVLVIP